MREVVTFRNGIGVYGGFPSGFGSWKVGDEPVPALPNYQAGAQATILNIKIPDDKFYGAFGSDITSPTHLQGFEIHTEDIVRECVPNVAMRCEECSGLRLRYFATKAGAGGPAAQATPPSTNMNGGNGGAGGGAQAPDSTFKAWYIAGGTSPFGHDGGTTSKPNEATHVGTAGIGPRGGVTGTSANSNGSHGGGGRAVPQGAHATHYGAFFGGGFWTCTSNTRGTTGAAVHGSGGGGSWTHRATSTIWGASGGGGGEGGKSGAGGRSGGASIGMALTDTKIEGPGSAYDPVPLFMHVRFEGGDGGPGSAGTPGGNGGFGGERGYYRALHLQPAIYGGWGGHGGGGNGGHGGHGGMTIGLWLHESKLSNIDEVTYPTGSGGQPGAGGEGGVGGPTTVPIREGEDGHPGESGKEGVRCPIHNSVEPVFPGLVLMDSGNCRTAP